MGPPLRTSPVMQVPAVIQFKTSKPAQEGLPQSVSI